MTRLAVTPSGPRGRHLHLFFAVAVALGCDSPPGGRDAGASLDDAGPVAGRDASSRAGCWQPDNPYRGPDACRDDEGIYRADCLSSTFLALDSPHLDDFQAAYQAMHGAPLSPTASLDTLLGFFIDPDGVFVSAIHPFVGCVQATGVHREYLAGRDGPGLECGEIEILYLGPDAALVPPLGSTDGACFDCVSMEEVGDVIVARVVEPTFLPDPLQVVELADSLPAAGSEVVALGKPEDASPIPIDARRVSLGRYREAWGRAVVVDNFLIPGFSGGPMLDACGRAFGVSVTKTSHLQSEFPTGWDSTWSIGVSLIAYRAQIDAALEYARGAR